MAGATDFEHERRRLTLLAYRMCGSWADAEDVVQNVALEWLRAGHRATNPAGWLTKVTVRRSIDTLRTRQRDATYPGPWLPEPLVALEEGNPSARWDQSEALTTAFLMLAETLTPPQRAVIVLRALGYGHAEAAEILDLTPAACRQHHVRGLRRLDRANGTAVVRDPGVLGVAATHRKAAGLLAAFLAAARRGAVEELSGLLHADVAAYQDGGGKTRAARRALLGVANVARFATGIAALHDDRAVRFVQVNNAPGAVVTLSGVEHVLSLHVRDDRIYRLFDVCNPDKQAHLTAPARLGGELRTV